MVDLLAEKLGMDPIDLAIKNFGHEWEALPDKSLSGVLLHEGAERIGWKEKRHAARRGPIYDGAKRRGVGFSFHPGWHAEWQEERRGEVQVGDHAQPRLHACCSTPPPWRPAPAPTPATCWAAPRRSASWACAPRTSTGSPMVDTDTAAKDCVQTDSAVAYLQSEVHGGGGPGAQAEAAGEAVAAQFDAAAAELDVADGRIFRRGVAGRGQDGPGAADGRATAAHHACSSAGRR